ncbi:unnamed protein product [Parnassius apollo]|uniref:(apollo) hypothetical protein n=1 Tax=Parnassius apollo TaxID=110799 RepID=A0A8S3XHX9_PARAO|nr:unnamed protein product [Parnassius apollo]
MSANKVEAGFVQAQSDNLPKVDSFMLFDYPSNHSKFTSAEVRGWKLQRSARETYGDDAVGFVQVQRSGRVCTVKAKITPEHRIKSKAYSCTFTCDEKEETVLNVDCHDCAAQKGGCKHSVAFLMWLHRRSEEPSPTEKKCYWAKPKLATIGTKFIKAKDMGPSSVTTEDKNTDNTNSDQFFLAVVQSLKEHSIKNQLSVYVTKNEYKKLSLHNLIHQYKNEGNNINSADDFIDYCSTKIAIEKCHKAEEATVCQASSPLWHELRYCRITASKVHEAAHCKTPDGALIEQIFGASVPETLSMKRGKRLESNVRAEVAKTRKIVIENCGFFLKPDWPHLGASPDGLTSEYVVEIKCPSTKKGKESFVKNSVIGSKWKAQIQLQMFLCNKVKGLFCVANENFESNKKVEIFEEYYDEKYCTDLLEKSTHFWKTSVFPKLVET